MSHNYWQLITHTHPFNGPFSRTTRVSWYQKGKTNLDFTEARDSEWQWHQLGHIKSAPCSRHITMPAPHHSVFYRPDALPVAQPTASKHWRQANSLCSAKINKRIRAYYSRGAHTGQHTWQRLGSQHSEHQTLCSNNDSHADWLS